MPAQAFLCAMVATVTSPCGMRYLWLCSLLHVVDGPSHPLIHVCFFQPYFKRELQQFVGSIMSEQNIPAQLEAWDCCSAHSDAQH